MSGMRQGHLSLVNIFTSGRGSTPMHAAVDLNRLDVIERLVLDEGLDINMVDTRTGQGAIYPAAEGGMLGIVEFLVKQKADLNRLDKSGWNVLAAAIRGRQPKVAQFLIANGANASQPNLGGRTALHEVVEVADMGTLAVLLKQGVFVDAQ